MAGFMPGLGPVATDEVLGRAAATRVFRRTAARLRPYRRGVLAAVAVMVGSTACLLAGPALVKVAIDRGLKHHNGGLIDRVALIYVAVACLAFLLGRLQVLLVARV